MIKVLIIASLVLVAQCKPLNTQETHGSQNDHSSLDAPSAQNELRKKAQVTHQVPPFPEPLETLQLNFNNLYRSVLAQEERKGRHLSDRNVAGVITPVSNAVYKSLIPIGSVDSLRDAKHHELSVKFALDSMSEERLSMNDPRFLSSEGVKVKTYGGRYLEIKKDPVTGGFSVNGVAAKHHELQEDGAPFVLELSDFLFNFRNCFTDAIKGLKNDHKALSPATDTHTEESILESRRHAETSGLIQDA